MPTVCFVVEERNRRPNPHLEEDIAERGGGPVELVDYVRVDTGEVVQEGVSGPYGLPPGSMLMVQNDHPGGGWPHAGPNLHVVLPDGHAWNADSRARNCGWPDDDEHHCWVWHGDPPNVTVENGPCPSGGAGSIASPGYHGFLRNGELTDG